MYSEAQARTRFEEQGEVEDDVLVSGEGVLDCRPRHLLVDLRVSDLVELLPLLLVFEDDPAKRGAIELSCVRIEDVGAKLLPTWRASRSFVIKTLFAVFASLHLNAQVDITLRLHKTT